MVDQNNLVVHHQHFFKDDEPEFEEFEGFTSYGGDCARGRRGRGRGRGRGRRFGRYGLHDPHGFGGPFAHPHPRYHHHHHPHPHHHDNHLNNKNRDSKDFVRQLKEERKEYRHELKGLQQMEKQVLKQCCHVDKKIDKLEKQMEKEKEKKQLKKEKAKAKIKVSCVCGERMLNVKVCEAYDKSLFGDNNNASVQCDICKKECIDNLLIYHCPNNGDSLLHPSGYDICSHCAKLQQKKFVKERTERKP